MQQYQNRDGVIVQAELLPEDAGEHVGLWHTVDANGTEGHVTDEQFQSNFSPVTPEPPAKAGKK